MSLQHADLYIARQIIELIPDRPWCWDKPDHTDCMIAPTAASWPEPNEIHDLDDPDWTPL